ncbi:MAG: hypothetical protein IKP20_06255 [Candidatus Methanomethylophilaceae archaeon]|nr:hypothetical protein [Candidatus Methanomethylophilaceae archaeon]
MGQVIACGYRKLTIILASKTIKRISDDAMACIMGDIYVVETADSDPRGIPWGKVLQISICRVEEEGGFYDTAYSAAIQADPLDLGKDSLDYISERYGINAESLYIGIEEREAVARVRNVLVGRECVSFDVGEVFGRYLSFEPWDLTREVTLLPSISRFVPAQAKPLPDEKADPLETAYKKICPDDPAGTEGKKGAAERAQMTASILSALMEAGMFRSEYLDR